MLYNTTTPFILKNGHRKLHCFTVWIYDGASDKKGMTTGKLDKCYQLGYFVSWSNHFSDPLEDLNNQKRLTSKLTFYGL